MKKRQEKQSDMNDSVFKQYVKLVDFLGKALGPDFEIILHDLRPGKGCVAAIANGHVSGRTLGAPLTDFALKEIAGKSYETNDYILNYKGMADNNRVLKSSTMFIKDGKGALVGMICINLDISRFDALKKNLMDMLKVYSLPEAFPESPQKTDEEAGPVEVFAKSMSDVIGTSLKDELEKHSVPVNRLTKEEKLAVVEELDKKGVFLLKGAVGEVASQLGCSEVSIYRYMSQISKENSGSK
jgi:predicted transcriptional regulator YheO